MHMQFIDDPVLPVCNIIITMRSYYVSNVLFYTQTWCTKHVFTEVSPRDFTLYSPRQMKWLWEKQYIKI